MIPALLTQDVEAAEPVECVLDRLVGGFGLGDVGLHYDRVAAEAGNVARDLIQAVAAPGNQGDRGALAGEAPRGCGADTAAGTGDERYGSV